MSMARAREKRLANGTCVHVSSDHFEEQCDGVIQEAVYDEGWLYRIEVTAGQKPPDATHEDGTVWVWDFEIQKLKRGAFIPA